jgi:D-alanyl-D-alanine carboxypeptidase/D-alanyl-D-alanine-endopeptidase (penicillin-binding protein 4)
LRDAAGGAERWLQRGIGAVGCVLLVALAGGSSASDMGRGAGTRPAAPATAQGATLTPAVPGSLAPSAQAVLVPAPVLGADPGGQPAPSAGGVARALASPLADHRLGGRVLATVLDAGSGMVLLDRGAARPATPASTAKLATAAAVLAVMRPDDRIVTRVVAGPRPGEVVLVGGGDPTLSAAPAGRPTRYEGAGRLAGLAAAARRAGVRRVTRVVVDGSRYSGPPAAPGWRSADLGSSFAAPVTAVAVDGGRAAPGALLRSAAPDLAAGRALAGLLGAPAAAVLRGQAGPGARVLGEVRSAPVARIVEQMLLASDNVLAEALARQVALAERLPASFAGAAEAVRRVLGRLGLPTSGVRLADGSGLSTRDRVPPAALAAVLRAAVSGGRPGLHGLVPGLPVGGYDGTLDDRYRTGPPSVAAGAVRAKTGSLDGVSALAGLVTDADGRLLVFAFMADAVPLGGGLAAEAALDAAAAALAGCGCR